jgi:hypothetical protein
MPQDAFMQGLNGGFIANPRGRVLVVNKSPVCAKHGSLDVYSSEAVVLIGATA